MLNKESTGSEFGLSSLVSMSGIISAIKYCEMLKEGLLLSYIVTNDLPYVLQQDNASFNRKVWQIIKSRVEKNSA